MEAVIAGATLLGTTVEKISEAINTDRNVTIQITNYSSKYTLKEPWVYTFSGYCHHPPQPTIKTMTQEVCSFSKTAHTACGSVGVMTYLFQTDEKKYIGQLAIMFSVPYDYNLYENKFALGFFEESVHCNENLYKKMYYDVGKFSRAKGTGSVLSYSGKTVYLTGTMSPQGQSIMKVELWDRQG